MALSDEQVRDALEKNWWVRRSIERGKLEGIYLMKIYKYERVVVLLRNNTAYGYPYQCKVLHYGDDWYTRRWKSGEMSRNFRCKGEALSYIKHELLEKANKSGRKLPEGWDSYVD